jgi:hypothetical protein
MKVNTLAQNRSTSSETPPPARQVTRRWLVSAQVAVAVLLFVYLARDGLSEFFSGDDLMNLYKYFQEPFRHWLKGLVFFWSSTYYRPFGGVAYLVPYSIFGFHPLAFRVIAFAALLFNLGLYFSVVTKLTQSARVASFALLLCAYHSAFAGLYQSYGTIYDITSCLFFFGGLLGYVRWRAASTRSQRVISLLIVFVCFLIGLSCKETLVALPGVLAAYDLILGGGVRRDKWLWPLRGGWPVLVCSVLSIVFMLGKMSGPMSLVNRSAYQPHFTLHQYASVTAHYLKELLYLSGRLPTPTGALWVVGTMLLASLLLRSRLMLFSVVSIVITQLPVSFIGPRGAFAVYIAWGFWALYVVALIDSATPLLRRPLPSAVAFAGVAGVLLCVHLRMKPDCDEPYKAQARAYQELNEHLDRWRFDVPKAGHILIANDPFPTDWNRWNRYDTKFLTSLHSRTTGAAVYRAKIEADAPAPSEASLYDYVIDYEGQWRLLSGPGHPLTPAAAERIERLMRNKPVRLLHGFLLPTPDLWRWTQQSFGISARCPHAGVNRLDLRLHAPQELVLTAAQASGQKVEVPLTPGRALHYVIPVQAETAGDVVGIEFRLGHRSASGGPPPAVIFFDAQVIDE